MGETGNLEMIDLGWSSARQKGLDRRSLTGGIPKLLNITQKYPLLLDT